MANTTLSANAVCPFFLNDRQPNTITCEGIYEKTTKTKFKNKAEKEAYAQTYCTSNNCENCKIYIGNVEKNEGRVISAVKKPPEIDYEYLKYLIKEKGFCLEGIASVLKIDRSSLYRKLRKGKSAISLQEYITIKKFLELTPKEARKIFGEV